MYLYGFELEGFYKQDDGVITIPPIHMPTDGFPGLVELRTKGGHSLEECAANLYKQHLHFEDMTRVTFLEPEYRFSGADMARLRKERQFAKDYLDIQNIYGRAPRRSGNKTLAAFQINISNMIVPSYTIRDKNGDAVTVPAQYGLLNVHRIVKNLDIKFADWIRKTNRQPGMYAIKDDIRLEYRSLPNCLWTWDRHLLPQLLKDIKDCVEN